MRRMVLRDILPQPHGEATEGRVVLPFCLQPGWGDTEHRRSESPVPRRYPARHGDDNALTVFQIQILLAPTSFINGDLDTGHRILSLILQANLHNHRVGASRRI
jgi:hypothetical protein